MQGIILTFNNFMNILFFTPFYKFNLKIILVYLCVFA
jgi:hypothetical protein